MNKNKRELWNKYIHSLTHRQTQTHKYNKNSFKLERDEMTKSDKTNKKCTKINWLISKCDEWMVWF